MEESDLALREARILIQAIAVFGNEEKALKWLHHGLERFGGRSPMQMVSTDSGTRLVEEVLVQIDEGYFL